MDGTIRALAGVVVVTMLAAASANAAEKVYEMPSKFIERHFGEIPKTRALGLSETDQKVLKKILGHRFASKRVRYWKSGDKLAWILSEVGKTEPITTGFIIRDGKIVEIKVLIYRESHGWEVSRPFFTRQFVGASLGQDQSLDASVDGIVGATLSVRALTKLSRVALYLSKQVE